MKSSADTLFLHSLQTKIVSILFSICCLSSVLVTAFPWNRNRNHWLLVACLELAVAELTDGADVIFDRHASSVQLMIIVPSCLCGSDVSPRAC